MKWKNVITVILVIFIIVSVGYMGFKELGNSSDQTEQENVVVNNHAMEGHRIIAYYFHGEVRCETCRQIEAYSHDALMTGFPMEIQDGDLKWQVVNVEDPDNEHFWQDFNLVTWSLVLVDTVNGRQERWKNLDKVWELVDDRQEFLDYVQTETQGYLGVN